MARISLGRPARKPTWDDLRNRLAVLAADSWPDVAFTFSDEPARPWAAWRDGPAISTVEARLGEVKGWAWAAVAPDTEAMLPPLGLSVDGRDPASTLWARRSYGDRALVVALVRFYGMRGRYFASADERHRDTFAGLLDVDDPAVAGYPIVDAVADAVLAGPDPDPEAAAADAHLGAVDRWSARLRRMGYENLWARAYTLVP